MGASPETTAFLKECLADALIKLLETKTLENITIPEITQLAGVGRTTYFRNFSSKEDMLSFKLIKLWERWAEEQKITKERRFNKSNTLAFLLFNYNIRPLLELMYRRGLQSALFQSFYDYNMPKNSTDPVDCYQSSIYSYGLFGLLDEWIIRGFRETPAEMIEILKKI